MVPPKFNPLLCQVNLLLTQYLRKTEEGKSVRYEKTLHKIIGQAEPRFVIV